MSAYKAKAVLAASTLALSALALAAPAAAQTKTDGTQGGVQGEDVSASTCGYGSTDSNSVSIGGCADAEARGGGTVDTRVNAKTSDRRAMQHWTATARDEDERARSRTHTIVRQGETVRSRTRSMYKQRGEKPVHQVVTTGSPSQTKKKPR
ncbi:MAG TPA: hypothetical protein VF605_06515 [Allosphingosinicella sp.]